MTCQRSLFFPTAETCGVKRRMDADKSPQIPTSAGSSQKVKAQPCFWMIEVRENHVITLEVKCYFYLQNESYVFNFNLHFCKMMHVLSLCICNRNKHKKKKSQRQTGMNLWIILVPQRNKFVFQLVPTGTPMKVPMFTGSQEQSRHIQEETSPPGSQTLMWTHKQKHLAHDAPLFSVFLSGFLSASLLLQYTHSWVHFTGKTWI